MGGCATSVSYSLLFSHEISPTPLHFSQKLPIAVRSEILHLFRGSIPLFQRGIAGSQGQSPFSQISPKSLPETRPWIQGETLVEPGATLRRGLGQSPISRRQQAGQGLSFCARKFWFFFARRMFCFPFTALCRRGELLSVRSDGK